MASKGDDLAGLGARILQAFSNVWALSTALMRLSVEISASLRNAGKGNGLERQSKA